MIFMGYSSKREEDKTKEKRKFKAKKNKAYVNQHQLCNLNGNALLKSSQNGSLPFVEFLVENGVDVNYISNSGATPLFFSSQNGHLLVVQYLIKMVQM